GGRTVPGRPGTPVLRAGRDRPGGGRTRDEPAVLHPPVPQGRRVLLREVRGANPGGIRPDIAPGDGSGRGHDRVRVRVAGPVQLLPGVQAADGPTTSTMAPNRSWPDLQRRLTHFAKTSGRTGVYPPHQRLIGARRRVATSTRVQTRFHPALGGRVVTRSRY